MAINITQFAPPGKVSTLVWDKDMEAGAGKIFKGDLTGNVTGNLSGKIIVNGCQWTNYLSSSSGSELQDLGYVSLIAKASVTSNTTTPVSITRYISYPYLGCIDFHPKPASPTLTFTVGLAGSVQSGSIGGQLNVYGADGSTVLRTYRKDNAIGTFTFPVDLTDAYRLLITSQGHENATVTSSIDSLYVRLPYFDSLVD